MKHAQEEAVSLMKEILQDEMLDLEVEAYTLKESFKENRCEICLSVRDRTSGDLRNVEGAGVGIVDATFQGLKARFSDDYPSLDSISFSAFNVKGLMTSGHAQLSDAEAVVDIGVRNSYDREFTFEYRSRSISHACIEATLSAVEYFVNSERAFIRMYRARKHYESIGRTDLVSKYTSLMSKMVVNTSYSEVIDRIKNELQ